MKDVNEIHRLIIRLENHCLLSTVSYCVIAPNDYTDNLVEKDHFESKRSFLNLISDGLYYGNFLAKLERDKNKSYKSYHTVERIIDIKRPNYEFKHINDDAIVANIDAYKNFLTKRCNKSYLFSVIVSEKYYEQVKADLITYAKLALEYEIPGKWHMKVITHDNMPFKLLNIFMTNTTIMQIVNLGYDLGQALDHLNEKRYFDDSGVHYLSNQQVVKILDILMHQTYIWKPIEPKITYQDQIFTLNQTNKQDVLNNLTEMVDIIVNKIVNENDYRYFLDTGTAIDALDLDNLLYQYDTYHASNNQLDYWLQNDTTAETQTEIKPIINKLLEAIETK